MALQVLDDVGADAARTDVQVLLGQLDPIVKSSLGGFKHQITVMAMIAMDVNNLIVGFSILIQLAENGGSHFAAKACLLLAAPIGLLLPLLDQVVDKVVVVHEELPIVPLGRNILGRDELSHPAKKNFLLERAKGVVTSVTS